MGEDPTTLDQLLSNGCPQLLEVIALANDRLEQQAGLRHKSRKLSIMASDEGVLATLKMVLAKAAMGLRLYVIGSEDNLWRCQRIAKQFGMNLDEIRLYRPSSTARPLYCVHCGHHTASVKTNIVICGGCGRHLFVRDHFSRRLGAYMGLQADAEAPSVLPATIEIYP